MSQATKKTQPNSSKSGKKALAFNCEFCDFKAETKTGVNLHKEALHSSNKVKCCEKCDFRYKTKVQHEKHNKIAHVTEDKPCWFWENDFCVYGNRCRFKHKTLQRSPIRKTPCFYQENCRKPDCQFGHVDQLENCEQTFLSNQNPWKQRMWRN